MSEIHPVHSQPSPEAGSPPQRRAVLSRRGLIGSAAAVGVGAPLAALGVPAEADSNRDRQHAAQRMKTPRSARAALGFLQGVTDAYRTTGPRLAQSYQDASGLNDIAFVYDNALTIIALLRSADVSRARALGDGLLYAQDHDESLTDGRLRQAYHADTFINPNGTAHFGWEFGLIGTAVGDMAWAGIALAQLARKTRDNRYLQGTLRIGRWILDNTRSTTGLGGYTFGETAGLEDHKSTEHNIDVYGYFRLLAQLTRDRSWIGRADHAWQFVTAVWNAKDQMFWTGSDDGAMINKAAAQLPLDPQTWSWLAARKRPYAGAVDWAASNLATTDTPLRANSALTGNQKFSGVAFASGSFLTDTDVRIANQEWNPKPDHAAVWLEGTSQLALALSDRGSRGDQEEARDLLDEVERSQDQLGKGQTFGGKRIAGGIVAATSPLDTGFGFGYYPNLHTAATSWYVFAATSVNPYTF